MKKELIKAPIKTQQQKSQLKGKGQKPPYFQPSRTFKQYMVDIRQQRSKEGQKALQHYF
jgi:hypothetical protein